jgi:hypothetical protein
MERDDGRGRVVVDVEPWDVDGVHHVVVPVRHVTGRRRGPAVGLLAVVVPDVERPRGKVAVARRAGAARQLGRPDAQTDDEPVPEAARGRGVGVEDRDHEALGALGEPRPGELR